MPGERESAIEERTRVFVALPYCFDVSDEDKTDPEGEQRRKLLKAYNLVIKYARTLHKTPRYGLTGYTVSRRNAFEGQWVMTQGEKAGTWVQDDICLLIMDFSLPLAGDEMRTLLEDIRFATVQSYYVSPEEFQDDVWVVAHSIVRQLRFAREVDWLKTQGVPSTTFDGCST